MAWVTPKTDWQILYDDEGHYLGDFFNAADYNRLKNNLVYLHDLAITLYPPFDISDMGADKAAGDLLYADEMNKIEANLDTINEHTVDQDYGTAVTFADNGATVVSTELNRLESAMLDMYERFQEV